jgi:glycosyltransferase involved in cell wall biosynthesis
MHTPETVSVVIPLYNAASFIEETLNSVLAQTYTDIRVYVIDDFSTDDSADVVAAVAKRDSRVTYHRMPKKGGCPAPTKNEGVRIAAGAFVAFSDHDDWWHPEKIAKQVAYFEANSAVNVLGCNVEIVDTERGVSLGAFWSDPARLTPETARDLVLQGPIYATTTCMMGRREYLLAHPFDERLLGSDEYDLSLHAALDNPAQVAILPETLAYWRWHSASLSHSPKAAERALTDETVFAEKVLARTDLSPEERAHIFNRVTMVTRRAGNAELEAGHRAKALAHYTEAVARGDRMSTMLLLGARFLPWPTRQFVTWKRSRSHATPAFR